MSPDRHTALLGRLAVSIYVFAVRMLWEGMVVKPLVLYSANTWLAYMIAEKFYRSEHYVWCTPTFDPLRNGGLDSALPPTSSPLEVYGSLAAEVARGDRHSSKVKENRAGILRGASSKKGSGEIGELQEAEIVSVVKLAEVADFRPVMYIIPYCGVADLLREPPPEDKAHPLSPEYIIDRLPRDLFDVIEFGDHW